MLELAVAVPFLHHGASHADSVRAAAAAGFRDWAHFIEGWRDFFLMTGTAAVTLAGLLFVAISLHIETLIHATREHLLSLARAILFSFVMVLTTSLMLLVPPQGIRPTGMELVLLGVVFGGLTLAQVPRGTMDHPDFPNALFRRRLMPTLVGYAMVSATGVALLVTRVPDLFFLTIGAFCMLLGNAVGASWDLLVRTAKVKRRDAEAAVRPAGDAPGGDRTPGGG